MSVIDDGNIQAVMVDDTVHESVVNAITIDAGAERVQHGLETQSQLSSRTHPTA